MLIICFCSTEKLILTFLFKEKLLVRGGFKLAWTAALVQALGWKYTQTHTGHRCRIMWPPCCVCVSSLNMHLCLCASVSGSGLMRYECILPSTGVFLRVTVKVNLSTGERVHRWWRQGHVSPTCPIWFRGLWSTLYLLFLPDLCTWGG